MKKFKTYIMLTFGGVIIILAVLFSTLFLLEHRNSLIEGIDKDLFNVVRIEKELFPADFHDKIIDKNSITPEEYNFIVDRNNKLCTDLNLQYLWSVIKINGKIHFTTSTSPDKNVKNNKQALFFAVHSNPEAFDSVFKVMKPVISEFHNEWGDGRMLLWPYKDKFGRKYCFGASKSIHDVNVQMRHAVLVSLLVLFSLLLIFIPFNFFLARSMSEPLNNITKIANNIAYGKPIEALPEKQKKWEEINSLNDSIIMMHHEIQNKIGALQKANTMLEKREEELRNQNIFLDKKVEKRTEELNKLIQDKDRFITILGHDLKSPFNAILGILKLLKANINKYTIDKIEHQINILNSSAQNTFNLLEDILIWARAQSGKLPFNPECLDVKMILNEVIDYLRPAANNKDIKIRHSLQDNVIVFADKNMLSTILRNLITNAIKFTNRSGIITIYLEQNEADFTFVVSDTGIGINHDVLEKLFDTSEKTSTPGTVNEVGTGLGLLICKEFTERHGGRIWVESEPGKGSDFKFTIPIDINI